ncbi:MAG: hypothetical protein ACHQ51_09455 [Elusimicrobiota bacterium]
MRPAAAAALAAVLTATGCAAGPRAGTRTVVVEGWAPLGARTRQEARRGAIADAQRRAMEEAAGVEVSAVSTVDDAGSVRERVSTTGRGTVRSSRVVAERVSEGMLVVRVNAVVELPKAGEVRRAGWIPGTGPRARVVSGSSAAAAALRRDWTAYGGACAGDDSSPELILRAAVESAVVDEPRLRPYVVVRVRLTLEATPARGGSVLWSASRESSAMGVDAVQARARALDAAAEGAIRAAADDLPARLWLTARSDPR